MKLLMAQFYALQDRETLKSYHVSPALKKKIELEPDANRITVLTACI